MEASTVAPPSVPTFAPKAGKTPSKPSLRTAIKPHQPPKVRKNGMVKSTILFDPPTNERLTALAFAWNTDRSELARKLVTQGLQRYDIAEELMKAAGKYKKAGDVSPDETHDRLGNGADVSEESEAA